MSAGEDARLDSRWIDLAVLPRAAGSSARWMGWRMRALVLLALLGSVALFALLRMLAASPQIDAAWQAGDESALLLQSSPLPALQAHAGQALEAIVQPDGQRIEASSAWLRHSPRWVVNDAERARLIVQQDAVAQALAQPSLTLLLDDGAALQVSPKPRGFAALTTMFWLLCALALVLYLIGLVVVLASPRQMNLLFALMALCQTGNLALIAIEALGGIGLLPGFARADLLLRTSFDVITGAAVLHACLIHPHRVPRAQWAARGAWATAFAVIALAALGKLPQLWWCVQALLVGYGAAAVLVLGWSYRIEPHPFAIVLRRLGAVATGTLALLTAAVALASGQLLAQPTIAAIGSVIWYVFFASLLLLVPFLSRSQQVMREFAMLAGISTVATSIDLLFVSVFALGQYASLTLSLFVALGITAGARQWILDKLLGTGMLTAERMFESLYRVAREVEAAPRKATEQLTKLLRELFEPLEVARTEHAVALTRVASDGSMLVVPLPRLPGAGDDAPQGSIVLRYARRGRRLFTREDARLTDRVLEQLRRAIAYDRAVEQGRSEERTRIAQDLHDDIGARLLTLMYKAQNPEMEEYIRHTLQDLKTLTRGLAAANHRLSHSAAEWKADIAQRLALTHCDLDWSFSADRDISLSVVQWSALTRVLRELVSNTIAHAQATQVEIAGQLERGRLTLTVSDDGIGRAPETWSHGLGLGGVRKRVKLLGGEVRWRERSPRGMVCEVRVSQFGER